MVREQSNPRDDNYLTSASLIQCLVLTWKDRNECSVFPAKLTFSYVLNTGHHNTPIAIHSTHKKCCCHERWRRKRNIITLNNRKDKIPGKWTNPFVTQPWNLLSKHANTNTHITSGNSMETSNKYTTHPNLSCPVQASSAITFRNLHLLANTPTAIFQPASDHRPNSIWSRNYRALTLECVVTGVMFEWYGSFHNYIVFEMLNCSFVPASHDIRSHHPPHPVAKCSNYAIIFIHSTHKMLF